VLGADHPNTLTSRANLAHWQVQTSRCSSVAHTCGQALNDDFLDT